LRPHEAALPEALGLAPRFLLIAFEPPLRIGFKNQCPAFSHKPLVDAHDLAVNATHTDTPVAINGVVLATVATNIALSNKLSEPITRFKSTRPYGT
jgi:hypothetical protein